MSSHGIYESDLVMSVLVMSGKACLGIDHTILTISINNFHSLKGTPVYVFTSSCRTQPESYIYSFF